MPQEVEVLIEPGELGVEKILRRKCALKAGIAESSIGHLIVLRRSLDARKEPHFRIRVAIYARNEIPPGPKGDDGNRYKACSGDDIIIIGAGPAGYFAALKCLEYGIRPLVLERGKDVQARRRDLKSIQRDGIVNPNSNYCFGEGGAGTYSDGKLYTRSKKRGSVRDILEILVEHGADPRILIEAHPHIGSNKLPQIIKAIRQTIEDYGGSVLFEHKVLDFILEDHCIRGVVTEKGVFYSGHVVLATGHSARDIYDLFSAKGLRMEDKAFAVGLRVEHPQELIDEIQYRQGPRHPNLPAASYHLACEVKGRGVFSFCMCPGGMIVPAATAPGEIVVNGMSLSRRDSPFANAGIVVAMNPQDITRLGYQSPLQGIRLQRDLETSMFALGDRGQAAPCQRLSDFVVGRPSSQLPASSYIPGLFCARLDQSLPREIYLLMRNAFGIFEKRMKGFVTEEAILVGVESRTSSPVRLPRDPKTLMHPQVSGLYPCGEGAGYAGGIVSAAIDGQRVADGIAHQKGLEV